MTETVLLLASIAVLVACGGFFLLCLCGIGYMALRVYPVVDAYMRAKDGKNYIHPSTGEATTFEEAVRAEEEMFSGSVPLSSWGSIVSRWRN